MNPKKYPLKKAWTSDKLFVFVVRIVLGILLILCIYPVVFTFITSVKTTESFYANIWGIPKTLYLHNYVEAFIQGHIGDYFINSVIIAIVTLLAVTVFGVFSSYALAKLNVPFVELIVSLLMIIQILPTESMIIPLYVMMSKLHLTRITYLPIVFAYCGWLLPVTMLVLKNFFSSVPQEVIEAARIDGSGELRTMFAIVMPMTKSALATCTVLNFCFIWGELMWAQIATLTVDKGIPLTVGLLNFQGQYQTNWGLLTAAICTILIPLFFVFIFLQKYFIAGLSAGAVKG
jgi:ABC-type glycerol-3-phosphate transport system permease component